MLELKLTTKSSEESTRVEIRDCGGVAKILKIVKRMINDEVVVRLGLAVFEVSIGCTPIIMDFIQFGGVELILKIIKLHEGDAYLRVAMPQMLKSVLGKSLSYHSTQLSKNSS